MRVSSCLVLALSLAVVPACLVDSPDSGDGDESVGTDAIDRKPGHQKVKVCHIPPGNPGNAHTIEVSQSAVPAHLSHGDTLGACNTPPPVCPPGETWDCYSAPLETDGIGICQRGTKTCLPDGS